MRRLPLLVLVSLSLHTPAWSQTPDAGVAPASPANDAPSFAAKFDQLWLIRDQGDVMKQMHALTSAALVASPQDFAVLVRAARLKNWEADGQNNGKIKQNYGQDAWALADRALHVKPDSADAQYQKAIGIGYYSQAIGVLTALSQGIEKKFLTPLDFAVNHDPGLEHGGPLLAKGRYWFELPWPKRDLEKSKQVLGECIAKYPENLRCYVFLAETELKDGDAKKAKATIQKAIQGVSDYDPPESRRAKQFAKDLAVRIEEELQ